MAFLEVLIRIGAWRKRLDVVGAFSQKLEGELEDLKKISSEITSHLSLIAKQQEEEALAKEQA